MQESNPFTTMLVWVIIGFIVLLAVLFVWSVYTRYIRSPDTQ